MAKWILSFLHYLGHLVNISNSVVNQINSDVNQINSVVNQINSDVIISIQLVNK